MLTSAGTPSRVRKYGRFTLYDYDPAPLPPRTMSFTGFTVTAMDGRIADAAGWGEHWSFIFFDSLTPAERKEFLGAVTGKGPRKASSPVPP